MKAVISFLLVFTLGYSWATDFSFEEYDKELYSQEKKTYNVESFRQRTVDFLEGIDGGELVYQNMDTKVLMDEKDQKISNLYIPNSISSKFTEKSLEEDHSGEKVLYLTTAGLKKNQVFLFRGTLYRVDNEPYQSTTSSKESADDMIVMDNMGNLFIHPKTQCLIQHSSFFESSSLSFAGTCFVENGKIKNLLRYNVSDNQDDQKEEDYSTALVLRPFQDSVYKKMKKNKHVYYVYDTGHYATYSKFSKNFLTCEDLGILCDLKSVYEDCRIPDCSFRILDLFNGNVLAKTLLPSGYSPLQIKRAQDKFFTLLQKKGEEDTYLMVQLTLKGALEATIDLLPKKIISFFGNVGESKGIGLLYDTAKGHFFSIFCPKKKRFTVAFPVKLDSSKKTVLEGQFIGIRPGGGSITFYNQEDGEELSTIKVKEFSKISAVENNLYYKEDRVTFVGYNLKDHKIFLKETVDKNDFDLPDAHIIDNELWFFESSWDKLNAYQVVENKLNKKWSFPVGKEFEFDELVGFKELMLTLDQQSKKIWGMHKRLGSLGKWSMVDNCHSIYKWDIFSGKLEHKDVLYLQHEARIIGFHSNGTPIIQTNHT